jgi:formate dehydrogenase major subunit
MNRAMGVSFPGAAVLHHAGGHLVTKGRQLEVRRLLGSLPLVRQVRTGDVLGLGRGAQSERSRELTPRTDEADRVVRSVCPYCAVGCGQQVFVKDEQITQIEGDPDSPISRGRLCPKGSATKSLVAGPGRETRVQYRRAYGTQWEELPLDVAMDMIADRVIKTREETWQERDEHGRRVNRTLGMASLGGATLDNEENYLIKKLFTALGAIQIENQARI